MPTLKNYTSTVPVERTVIRIEQALARAGASSIRKDYKEGELIALSFQVRLSEERTVTIRLPANTEAVFQIMRQKMRRLHKGSLARLSDQALRTAWKLMQDWVEVQLSLIAMQQADFLQVFLPYVWDGQQSFYDQIKGHNYKALPAPQA